ncbi:MAG: RNA-binding transcriptional accessory protein [Deltaproteobacteria bacterium]|nr:RNA-binding transcriptional accessory protein [Deltaproteobacteria bacterium]MBT4269419.1 RNA-binding transcriptional accessory protein [Deltaproteobacteria bacterium]MBT7153052.1 RNA-binding transcriptional accessory protein [Deltaproteobacteria bacterium]
MNITQTIAIETALSEKQITNVINMLNDGNTIPFMARYRKENTDNLDEVQLRLIRDRFEYISELEHRKEVVLKSIDEQGKLTDELAQAIHQVTTKQVLEDLYLPFKPKKRTRATIGREMGLEPLAELMKNQENSDSWLTAYLAEKGEEIEEVEAKQRARDILAEWISEDAEIRDRIREISRGEGIIKTEVQKEFAEEKTKFEMYYDYNEPVRLIPAHRYLAVRRGEEESVLKLRFELPIESNLAVINKKWIDLQKKEDEDLRLAIIDGYQRLIVPSLEVELRLELKSKADEESIKVFGENLRNLLLAPLGGTRMILGLDPGFKSGTKVVVVDDTGKYLGKTVIYPTFSEKKVLEAEKLLDNLLKKYPCEFICIGNGTASREVMQFTRNYLKKTAKTEIQPVIVNESGASVYSASEAAREEFPDLDVSFRGSISIARRFQDPLAELVKIDPKSIGVGQYQHDVDQKRLKKSLDEVVESCVNFVGVNLNTASASLLSYVSGLNNTLAKNVVAYRNENGAFKKRKELIKVPRFGPKSFEQSAGFLRIKDGADPLDQSAVHPENYKTVKQMAADCALSVTELISNNNALDNLDISRYKTETVGNLTLRDIIAELKKPGRDPRTSYVGAQLNEDVQTIKNLEVGMSLEGTVTNMTKFGAFVDLGVHHDGLVHISEMSNRFIKDPGEICGVGDIVKVTVLSVDLNRNRIALSMKTKPSASSGRKKKAKPVPKKPLSSGEIENDLEKLADKFKGL